jgi:hypothetical protein
MDASQCSQLREPLTAILVLSAISCLFSIVRAASFSRKGIASALLRAFSLGSATALIALKECTYFRVLSKLFLISYVLFEVRSSITTRLNCLRKIRMLSSGAWTHLSISGTFLDHWQCYNWLRVSLFLSTGMNTSRRLWLAYLNHGRLHHLSVNVPTVIFLILNTIQYAMFVFYYVRISCSQPSGEGRCAAAWAVTRMVIIGVSEVVITILHLCGFPLRVLIIILLVLVAALAVPLPKDFPLLCSKICAWASSLPILPKCHNSVDQNAASDCNRKLKSSGLTRRDSSNVEATGNWSVLFWHWGLQQRGRYSQANQECSHNSKNMAVSETSVLLGQILSPHNVALKGLPIDSA